MSEAGLADIVPQLPLGGPCWAPDTRGVTSQGPSFSVTLPRGQSPGQNGPRVSVESLEGSGAGSLVGRSETASHQVGMQPLPWVFGC